MKPISVIAELLKKTALLTKDINKEDKLLSRHNGSRIIIIAKQLTKILPVIKLFFEIVKIILDLVISIKS